MGTINGTYIVDIIDAAVPKTKKNKNPIMRCLYVISGKHGHGFSVAVPVTFDMLFDILVDAFPNGIFDQEESLIDLALLLLDVTVEGAPPNAPLTLCTSPLVPDTIEEANVPLLFFGGSGFGTGFASAPKLFLKLRSADENQLLSLQLSS